MGYCDVATCYEEAFSFYDYCSSHVCSYGGCGNERYKSSSGTRYKYCGTHCCGASDCMNESWKNEYTGTRYKYCENRACCLCCMLQTQLKRSPDRCWQGDCTRQAVSRTDRCSAHS